MIFSTFLTCIIFIVWIYVLWSRRKFYKLMLQIPGPMGYPLIGILHRLCGKNAMLTELEFQFKNKGALLFTWFGPVPLLIVADPRITQEIFTSPHSINKASVAYDVMEDITGNGLVPLKDPLWRIHRRALNPSFGHNILVSFLPIFNAETGSLLQKLDTLANEGEHNLFSLIKNHILMITIQSTIGGDIKNEESYQDNSLMESFNCLIENGVKLLVSPWLNNKLMRYLSGIGQIMDDENSKIRKLIKKYVDRKLQTNTPTLNQNKPTEKQRNIFINQAIELFKSKVFSYQDVIDESLTFVTAAFETTSMSIGYTLFLLALYPDYQERVYNEIKSVFPKTGDFEVTYEEIQKLEYLAAAINESMRLLPAVPIIARRLIGDLKLSNGIVLPKGLNIGISIFHVHRNKDIWGPDAEVFNPENCLTGNLKEKHSYALIPFSKGKRNCMGWKYATILMKITLVKILRNYKLTTSSQLKDLIILNNMTLQFRNMPNLYLERRTV